MTLDVVSGYHRIPKEEVHDKLMESIIHRHKPNALEWWARAAIFDAWCMLCPFIPIESIPVVDIILPLPGEHMRTPLNYPGGRSMLSLLFRHSFQPREYGAGNAIWVKTLLDCFKTLDTDFRSPKSPFQSSPLARTEILHRMRLLRQIHEKTSEELSQRQVAVPALVGVHALTVMSASKTALANWNNDLDCVDQGFAIHVCVPRDLVDEDRMHLLACCYVDEIEAWKKYAFDRDRNLMQPLGDDTVSLYGGLSSCEQSPGPSRSESMSLAGLLHMNLYHHHCMAIRHLSGSCRCVRFFFEEIHIFTYCSIQHMA